MPNSQIRVGDVVQLKSGGPHMTVSTIDNYAEYMGATCIWFKSTEKQSATFPLDTLAKVDTDSGTGVAIL